MSQESLPVFTNPLLLAGDSPARISVVREDKRESTTAADPIWFLNSCDSSQISNHVMHCLKMSQTSAIRDLKPCLEKLPRSGTMRNGTLYELSKSPEGYTKGKECSFLPTVTKSDAAMGNLKGKEYNGKNRHAAKIGNILAMIPTNTCRDYKGGTVARVSQGNPKRALDCEMQVHGLILQPSFAEWMDGFPIGWTELSPSETPLSRSKSIRYSKRSQTLKDAELRSKQGDH